MSVSLYVLLFCLYLHPSSPNKRSLIYMHLRPHASYQGAFLLLRMFSVSYLSIYLYISTYSFLLSIFLPFFVLTLQRFRITGLLGAKYKKILKLIKIKFLTYLFEFHAKALQNVLTLVVSPFHEFSFVHFVNGPPRLLIWHQRAVHKR